jgi:hypothetical protein
MFAKSQPHVLGGWTRWIVLLAAFSSASPVQAGFYTADELVKMCLSDSKLDYVLCVGYIDGTIDTFELSRTAIKLPRCVPSESKAREIKDVVVNFLSQNPEQRNYDAADMIIAAIGSHWQCKWEGQGDHQ